jgi:hypothetical protein
MLAADRIRARIRILPNDAMPVLRAALGLPSSAESEVREWLDRYMDPIERREPAVLSRQVQKEINETLDRLTERRP